MATQSPLIPDSHAAAAGFRYPTPTDEDLPGLARLAYDLSSRHCDRCRDYHVMWPYLRALGCNGGGPEYSWPHQQAAVADAIRGRSGVRWLLAGSADAGQLALVSNAIAGHSSASHSITVVDRCLTPLGLCGAYASAAELPANIVHAELTAFAPEGAFDVMLLHHVLGFIEPAECLQFLSKVRTWLAPGGRMLVWLAYRRPEQPGLGMTRALRGWREEIIRAEAASGAFQAPENLDDFVARLDRLREKPKSGSEGTKALEYFTRLIADAGFQLSGVADLPFDEQERTLYGPNPVTRCIVVGAA